MSVERRLYVIQFEVGFAAGVVTVEAASFAEAKASVQAAQRGANAFKLLDVRSSELLEEARKPVVGC